ncbi:MAG TPA: glycosyltransferase family 4 protein [Rhizomicrobium sp.]|nr:glycosyltransferase family 4 protein [Rhizomicrobium sp.]
MRLLFFDFYLPFLLRDADYPVGGWAVQLKHLLQGLKENGHEAGVLTWKGAEAYTGAQSTCELVETYDKSRGIRKLRLFYYFIPSLVAAARSFRPDVVVQSCSGVDTALMALVARCLGVPFIHRIACDTDTDGRYELYLDSYERIAFRVGLRAADLVICQNQYQLSRITSAFPRKRTHVLHNAIPIPAQNGELRPRGHRNYIAWVGVFKRQKNLGLLLRMARRCPDMEFRVAGAPPPHMDSESAGWLEELRREPNVRLVGYVTRNAMPDFLDQAVALLSTSDFEGFSNAFLEAFAVGTPVVAREAIDPDSIIGRNSLGLVARDETELGKCLDRIWQLPASGFAEMAQACRSFVREHHAPVAKARELVAAASPLVG